MMTKELTLKLDTITLAAKTWGDASKPKILALHGFLDNAASFDQLAPLLANDYYIVALDLPGHGFSDALSTENYSFAEIVDIVIQMLDKLAWPQCILLGHSLGATLCTAIASEFPARVLKLISIDAVGPLSTEAAEGESLLAKTTQLILSAKGKTRSSYLSLQEIAERRAKMNGVTSETILPIIKRGVIKKADRYVWNFDPNLLSGSLFTYSEKQALDCLRNIRCPVLIIEGEQGLLMDNLMVEHRKSVIKNLQVLTLPGGHHLHLTEAENVSQHILKFLS